MAAFRQPGNKQLGTTKAVPEKPSQARIDLQVGEIKSMYWDLNMTCDAISRITKQPIWYVRDVVLYRHKPWIELREPYSPVGFHLPKERR